MRAPDPEQVLLRRCLALKAAPVAQQEGRELLARLPEREDGVVAGTQHVARLRHHARAEPLAELAGAQETRELRHLAGLS
jgi:hypothetical protein